MKCQHPNGTVITFLGHEVEACKYVELEKHYNVDIAISKCKVCGAVLYEWYRKPDTIDEYFAKRKELEDET